MGLHGGPDRSWGQRGVQAEQVSNKTSNMGGSHRGSRTKLGLAIVPGGDDVDTYDIGELAFKTVKSLCVPGAQTSTIAP